MFSKSFLPVDTVWLLSLIHIYTDTIVIFLTANDQESDQIRGYEVGAVDYITKPFVIGALQRKIKAMFATSCGLM